MLLRFCLRCWAFLSVTVISVGVVCVLSLAFYVQLGGTLPNASHSLTRAKAMLVDDWWIGRTGHVRPDVDLPCQYLWCQSASNSSCGDTSCVGCWHCQPKVHLITYGNSHFKQSKQRLVREAKQTQWFETVAALGPESLHPSFRSRYARTLNHTRGGGYWIWKLHIIHQSLELINEGEFLVYLDAGCTINERGQQRFVEYIQLVKRSNYDILSFQTRYPEHVFTTSRIFDYFNVSTDWSAVRDSGMYIATILVMQKGPHLRTWLGLALRALSDDQGMFTDRDERDSKAADPRFRTPRHDQSVMSVTRKLVGSVEMPDETWTNVPDVAAWLRAEGGFFGHIPFWSTRIKV